MKKLLLTLLVAVLALSLAACKVAEKTPDNTPDNTDNTMESTDKESTPGDDKTTEDTEKEFSFTLEGKTLVPGQKFDASALREADSVYEVPSCALEGSDLVYNYTSVEITAFDDGSGPVIYCIYIADPNTATDEGLMLGDSVDKAKTLYGTDFTEDAGQMVYTRGETQLILLSQDGSIISIELRMVTE